jgi:hypothetical protein
MRLPLKKCLGLDTRPAWQEDSFSLLIGDNLQVMPGGSIECRPAVVRVVDLLPESVGLYARGNFLRAVVPSGHEHQDSAPTGVIYDGIGRGAGEDYAGKIDQILAVDTFGVSQVHGPHGYVAIHRSDVDRVEHHWIKEPPADTSDFVDTYVRQPFQPGRALLKIADKIVTTDPANGYIRYCSTLFGPDNWVLDGDAGFEAALQHVRGSREVISLGVHRSQLAVFFADAVQLWQMDQLTDNIYLRETLNGPGTEFPWSVAEIYGDAHFLSRSGFSNLSNAEKTGEAVFADIGDRVKTLTDTITSTDVPLSLWSQKRGQWLVAVGTTIYIYANYPNKRETSWMRWSLPVAVDALTENQGIVYIRSGNTLYRLDDSVGRDSGAAADIDWTGETRQLGGLESVESLVKGLNALVVQSTARTTWTPVCDGRVLTNGAVRIPGDVGPRRSGFSGSGRRVGVRFSGNGRVRIDGVTLHAQVGGM